MQKLIEKYKKKDKAEILHKLRVAARKKLSKLEKEGKIDLGLKNLLKKSSKLRDTDVLLKICKDKEIKKFLKKRHKKLRQKFLEFLENDFKRKIIQSKTYNEISIENCIKVLSESFLNKDDKTLHKIRIKIKKCRYNYPEYEEFLKPIQENLGKAHDYYNCEKLRKKFHKSTKKIIKRKLKYIEKAEKVRKILVNDIFTT